MSELTPLPLSVLDLATVGEGSTPAAALAAMLDLARHVERLGFTRFWLAEHHAMPGIASSAPAVLIAAVAGVTRTLRVGSGGVMLPNHAPLVVAEQFGTLANLYPDRIDLGIGRAPGTDQLTAAALRRTADGLSAEHFPAELGELIRQLAPDGASHGATAGHTPVSAFPKPPSPLPIWLLGSSGYSARLAGMLGLPFAFAHHFSAANTVPALELYRASFTPSAVLGRPYAMIAVQVIAAETDAEADRIALPSGLSFLRLRQGRPGRLPSPEEAAAYPWTPLERQAVAQRQAEQAVGGPDTVRDRLARLLGDTDADELMITSMVHDRSDRLRSAGLVRDLFGPGELPAGLGRPLSRAGAAAGPAGSRS